MPHYETSQISGTYFIGKKLDIDEQNDNDRFNEWVMDMKATSKSHFSPGLILVYCKKQKQQKGSS